jgi:hypothetical protein
MLFGANLGRRLFCAVHNSGSSRGANVERGRKEADIAGVCRSQLLPRPPPRPLDVLTSPASRATTVHALRRCTSAPRNPFAAILIRVLHRLRSDPSDDDA